MSVKNNLIKIASKIPIEIWISNRQGKFPTAPVFAIIGIGWAMQTFGLDSGIDGFCEGRILNNTDFFAGEWRKLLSVTGILNTTTTHLEYKLVIAFFDYALLVLECVKPLPQGFL